ncbi:MAG: ATP-binding protein [Bacteroidales bacterium]|nr:ATP-binding protein [Bacteroidales bacterium]
MVKESQIKLRRGLAFKMIIYVFVSIMVIFILIFHYTLKITRDIVVENLKSNAEYLTKSTVSKIEKVLSSIQRVPDNFAQIYQQNDFDEAEMNRLLRMMVENNKDIIGACLAFEPFFKNQSEKFYSFYYYRKDDKIEFLNLGNDQYVYFYMDWYQIPKELGTALWSEPYFDTGGADMLLSTYSVPLYSEKDGEKKFVGILTIDLSLDWLQLYVNEIKVYETGYAFMISKTGSMITHPIKDFIMNETIFSIADEQKSSALREIGRHMIEGETSFAEIEYRNMKTGKLSWIAYAPVPLNSWSLGVVFPVDEFMADANRLRMIVMGLGLGGGAILILIIILISRSITSPLRRLTLATETFAKGEFDVELPVINSKDEIGRLNAAFHYMQDTLTRTISDLKEAGEKLEISHAKLEEYNRTLEQKVEERTATLKAAQTQLIQSEKMASLGQLTAGIAHEIKNPLNFVNNFSELSVELAGEVIEEIDKLSGIIDPKDSDYLKGILRDIESNVKKINEHGKRADSIIRGMLLHSRGKSGEIQPTDLNALLGEYVALGYHGLRATDNTFNIKIESEYDPSIGLVNVVPQDMSRVFLNLINNACYSTAQKKKELKDSYFPILRVSTQKTPDKIIIRIWDNGKGIPQTILDRIFNPFFTTKPAGSGTGLGLSISYDIIVQEHNGEVKVDSKEGEFAEFTISLPN